MEAGFFKVVEIFHDLRLACWASQASWAAA
jgi:hypothetical protein